MIVCQKIDGICWLCASPLSICWQCQNYDKMQSW